MGPGNSFVSLPKSEIERINKCIRDAQDQIYGAQGQIYRAQGFLSEASNLLSARTCSEAATIPTPSADAEKVVEEKQGNFATTSEAQKAASSEAAQLISSIMPQTEGAEAESGTVETETDASHTKSVSEKKPARPPRFSTTPMTDEQQAFLRSQLSYTRKTKNAVYFLTPVDHIALKLPTYTTIVTQPMDLGTIDTKLRSNEYSSVQAFVDDIQLIVDNALKFNGPSHAITHAAYGIKTYVHERLKKYATKKQSNAASVTQLE